MSLITYKKKFEFTRLLDQKEVAEMLGVSTKTLECWRWKKKGPRFIKLGRLARYMDCDVLAYIDRLQKEEVMVSSE